jgi:hypothetical protein
VRGHLKTRNMKMGTVTIGTDITSNSIPEMKLKLEKWVVPISDCQNISEEIVLVIEPLTQLIKKEDLSTTWFAA